MRSLSAVRWDKRVLQLSVARNEIYAETARTEELKRILNIIFANFMKNITDVVLDTPFPFKFV